MAERDVIKTYLTLLEGTEAEHMKIPALKVFDQMDRLKNNLCMVSMDLDSVKESLGAMSVEAKGMRHVRQALSVAVRESAAAWEYYSQAEALVLKGAENAAARFRAGSNSALERPLSIQATEQQIVSMEKCLRDAFAAVDIGIGRAEKTEGMYCHQGHYWKQDRFVKWEDGGGDPALVDLMWYMRGLEQVIGQSYEAAHEAAVWVDCLRPKGRVKFDWTPIRAGAFYEKETANQKMNHKKSVPPLRSQENQTEKSTGKRAEPGAAAKAEKPSVRKRLRVAEDYCHTQFADESVKAKGSKGREAQR